MALWAVYSDHHTEINVGGDRAGLHWLAHELGRPGTSELPLDEPPQAWHADGVHAVDQLWIAPSAEPAARIRFQRHADVLVVTGTSAELRRILAAPIGELADGPMKINGVGAHLHLDPTSDPECRWYAPGSGSLVINHGE